MAASKYIHRVIPITKEKSDAFDAVRSKLSEQLGFQPSLSDTLAYLVNYYDANEASKRKAEQV